MNTRKMLSRREETHQLLQEAAKALAVKEAIDEHCKLVAQLVDELPDEFFLEPIDVIILNPFRL